MTYEEFKKCDFTQMAEDERKQREKWSKWPHVQYQFELGAGWAKSILEPIIEQHQQEIEELKK